MNQAKTSADYADIMHSLKQLLGGDQLIIEFIEPDTMHPKSNDTTIAEVAHRLEERYHLIEMFAESIKEEVTKRFALEILRNKNMKKAYKMLEQYILNAWREYILEAQHGITTKASMERGSEPFVDTGAYFENLRCRITNTTL